MRVALIGATGNAGSRILSELTGRGHTVTAIVRQPGRVPPLSGVIPRQGDVADAVGTAALLAGHDAAVSSVRFIAFDLRALLDAVIASGVPRYHLVVRGAGSLELAPGQLEFDRPDYPEAARENSKQGGVYLDMLRGTRGLDWTYLSPSRKFFAGARTGTYRLGRDAMLIDAEGASSISFQDFAKAMVDELEAPHHSRMRVTVGY